MTKETLQNLEDVAVVVQFTSMALEIIGIGLAIIELRFKPVADKLESYITNADARARDFAYGLLEHKWFSVLVTLFIFVVFFFEIPYMFDFWSNILPPGFQIVQDILFWLTVPILLGFFLGLFIVLLSAWITSLHKFSRGRPIGALGVFVASMGVTGEFYQVTVIMINKYALITP